MGGERAFKVRRLDDRDTIFASLQDRVEAYSGFAKDPVVGRVRVGKRRNGWVCCANPSKSGREG